MSTPANKTLQYSPDQGRTWMGPFSREEIENLRQAGIIEAGYPIRDTAPRAAAPQPGPQADSNHEEAKVHYLDVGGTQRGPFSMEELKMLVQRNTATPETQYWTQGMADWQPLRQALPELFDPQAGCTLGKLEGFSVSAFFAETFKRHKDHEVEELFCCGTAKTTPPLAEVKTGWPSPWIFARMLVLCLALYFGFDWACTEYQNPRLVPGLMFVGNFGIPLCVVVLFFELNVRREVPFTKVATAMVLGGLISLILTHILGRTLPLGDSSYWAGPIEETAKLFTVVLIASTLRNGRILTGMLLGCAVGAGFAAFESAGYTFELLAALIAKSSIIAFLQGCNEHALAQRVAAAVPESDPDSIMQMRALITPFGHVVWSAITAGAFWFVQKVKVDFHQRTPVDHSIDFSILKDMRFLRIALIPVGLHMFWNCELLNSFGIWKYIALGLVAWVVALRLIQTGLMQVKADQKKP